MKETFGWNRFLVNALALLILDSETLRNSGILSGFVESAVAGS